MTVVCNQTGDKHTVKVSSLSKECGDVTEDDLKKAGLQLLLTFKGKDYPVSLIVPESNTKKRKRINIDDSESDNDTTPTDHVSMM